MLGKEFFIIRQPVKFFTKNDTPVNFSQIFAQNFSQIVTFSVKKFYQFHVYGKVTKKKRRSSTELSNNISERRFEPKANRAGE